MSQSEPSETELQDRQPYRWPRDQQQQARDARALRNLFVGATVLMFGILITLLYVILHQRFEESPPPYAMTQQAEFSSSGSFFRTIPDS